MSAAILGWRFSAEVIKAIQPFVSPFYDRMPGLISVVDPPFVAKKAPGWARIDVRQIRGRYASFVFFLFVHGENLKSNESGSHWGVYLAGFCCIFWGIFAFLFGFPDFVHNSNSSIPRFGSLEPGLNIDSRWKWCLNGNLSIFWNKTLTYIII